MHSRLSRLALLAAFCTLAAPVLAQSVLLDHRTATYGIPLSAHGLASGLTDPLKRTLVTFNALPQAGDYEILGRVDVYSRFFGSTRTAMKLLAEKARAMGANAVVETGVWMAPAFPVPVAPHGTGIAVRVRDRELLQRLGDSTSHWE